MQDLGQEFEARSALVDQPSLGGRRNARMEESTGEADKVGFFLLRHPKNLKPFPVSQGMDVE